MAARIFLRDIAGCKAGQIEDLDWSAFEQSALVHHGVDERIETYAVPVEEAARRYVASLQGQRERETARGRQRPVGHDA